MRKGSQKNNKVNNVKKISKGAINDGINILNKYKDSQNQKRMQRVKKAKEDLSQTKNSSDIKPIIICFIIIILTLAVVMFFEYGPIVGISFNKENELSDKNSIEITSSDGNIYKSYNSNLLVYSNQEIKTYDLNGNVILDYNLPEVFEPEIATNGRYMAVYNKYNGKIYFFESNREVLDIKIDGQIEKIYIDDNGSMAVEHSSTGFKKIIGVYNKKGDNTYNAYLDVTPVISLKFLESSRKIIVAQTSTDTLTMGISIKEIDGSKTTDNIKELAKFDNSMLYDLTIYDQNIIMLLDNQIVKYNIDSKKIETIKSFNKNQISFVMLESNYYASLEDEAEVNNLSDSNVQHSYILQTSRYDNRLISKLGINNVPKLVEGSKYLVYLIYQDRLNIINKWGISIKSIPIKFPPNKLIVFNNGKSLGLVYSNKIYIYNI